MSADKKCFVIFPFSEPYESRYKKIYEPALREAGLQVERAGGSGVEIITQNIEENIKKSLVCFADLTENNANVWYEVGYAYAHGKKVVMACNTDKRPLSKLPFDIKHRSVIGYSNTIDEDENACIGLGLRITKDAKVKMEKAQQEKSENEGVSMAVPSAPSEKSQDEVVCENLTKRDTDLLKRIMDHCLAYNKGIADSNLKDTLYNNPIKVQFSLEKLEEEGYIHKTTVPDSRGGLVRSVTTGYIHTPKAKELARNNRHLF